MAAALRAAAQVPEVGRGDDGSPLGTPTRRETTPTCLRPGVDAEERGAGSGAGGRGSGWGRADVTAHATRVLVECIEHSSRPQSLRVVIRVRNEPRSVA